MRLGLAPKGWWNKPIPPREKVCYRAKSDALRVFLDHNYRIVENYGGPDYHQSPAEFDAVNRKYGTSATSIADAVWAALPIKKRPYCLTDIDLEALNDTSPAREAEGAGQPGFALPDFVHEKQQPPPPSRTVLPKPPKKWKGKCRTWRRAQKQQVRKVADQCFEGKGGKERCVCRYKGRFVPCDVVPDVPF